MNASTALHDDERDPQMRKTILPVAATLILALAACSGDAESTAPETVSATVAAVDQTEASSAPPVASAKADDAPKPEPEPAGEVTIAEVGIGQDGEYGHAAALVHTAGHLGEFLTVHFNVFDAGDELVASGEQVEQITSEKSTLAVGTMIELGDVQAARVDATYAVTDYGMPFEALPELEPAPVTLGEWGSADIRLSNTTNEPWQDLRIGIICRNADGAIVGGGDAYPDLVPANAESLASGHVTASDSAQDCTAYPQHGGY